MRGKDSECPVTKLNLAWLLMFLPRACSVIWIEYKCIAWIKLHSGQISTVSSTLNSLQSSNLRLNLPLILVLSEKYGNFLIISKL